MIKQGLDIASCYLRIIPDLQAGSDKWTDQPAPNCSLMIRAIALLLVAAIMTNIRTIKRCEASQAVRCQQVTRTGIHDGFLFGIVEQSGLSFITSGERDSK